MPRNSSLGRILVYTIVPFVPYLIGYYLIFAREDWGSGISIVILWSVIDATLTVLGQDLFIIWQKIPDNQPENK